MERLVPKITEVEIEFPFLRFFKRHKRFLIRQASLGDVLAFYCEVLKKGNEIHALYEILNKFGKVSMRELCSLPVSSFTKVYTAVLKAYSAGFIGDGKEEKKLAKKGGMPMYAYLALLCSKLKCSPAELLQLTWMEIEFWGEGVEWNLNAQTKKGRQKNRLKQMRAQAKKEISDEDALLMARQLQVKIDAERTKNANT
jgi:predicted transcriptional regulator